MVLMKLIFVFGGILQKYGYIVYIRLDDNFINKLDRQYRNFDILEIITFFFYSNLQN